MFILQAPAGAIQVTVVLPSPEWDDNYKIKAESRLKRSMNNVVYTYIRNSATVRLAQKFKLAQAKMLELLVFIQSFYTLPITITDHNGIIWIGFIVNDPVSFEAVEIHETNLVALEWDVIRT